MLAAHINSLRSSFLLFDDRNDLLLREPAVLHLSGLLAGRILLQNGDVSGEHVKATPKAIKAVSAKAATKNMPILDN